ncbi:MULTISPECIES: hypothetical protein [Candidatus Ichthyocystis]|uniref:Uncharacterized protein n=1 Tax=Candidatus Ichthyocystis hellenicum TaxID=1561003 RepID=A0A0S4M3K5_9BURK|nr:MULTISPECIES: hypothetical protein [Ichthyocystis]CUT18270.1 hypothetical protein Ark11_1472 [Candidatus Ichthyocystis hellenicum]
MYPYNSSNDFTLSSIDINKKIKNDVDGSTTEQSSCKDNKDFGYCVGVASQYDLSQYHDELLQEGHYQEKLLPPDIFKLTKSFDTKKSSTSHTAKCTPIKDEPLSKSTNPNILPPKQSINKESIVKKNISINLYTRSNLWHTKYNQRIVYIDAIKRIDIDNKELFKNSVLEKIGKIIEKRYLLGSSIDLSQTYLNIRKYILDKISLLINEDTSDSEILITPGMSVSDLRSSCILNTSFFKKLRDACEKIVKDIQETPDDYLTHILQSNTIFSLIDSNMASPLTSTNTAVIRFSEKKKFLPKLKELIMDTVSNLDSSIICEIKKIDQKNIVSSLFTDAHGVLVSKSLIKNLNLLFKSNENKFASGKFDDNLSFFNNLLEKIGNLVRASCIFHEGVFLPDQSTAEQISKYLLSDMYGISSRFHKKIKLSSNNVALERNYRKGIAISTLTKEKIRTLKLNPTSIINTMSSKSKDMKAGKIEASNDHRYEEIATTSIIKNINQPTPSLMIKEFDLRMYRRTNLYSAENSSSIYEEAIKKIDIDSNKMFMSSVMEEIGAYIKIRGLSESSINIYQTYSNVRKYILERVSPYIRNIVTVTDVLITPEVTLSDLRSSCISNNVFFEKLTKKCDKIVRNISTISDDYFSSIIQNYIFLDSSGRLRITNRKNKLLSKVKLLIMETISNLKINIINELKKFKQSEVVSGLFSNIHGVHIPKSLIRNLHLFFNQNKLPNNDHIANLDSLNDLFTKLLNKIKTSPMLHEEKLFFPGKYTTELMSKYLLLDIYEIPFKFHTKLELQEHISNNVIETNHEKGTISDNYDETESKLLEKSILIPQKKSKWSPNLITYLNIYELAISMIDIDKGNFENSFIYKFKNYPLVKEYFSEKWETTIDFSTTYNNVKNHILGIFYPFLKKIEEEVRIKPINGMTIDELIYAYVSNEDFFNRLREFCTKVISSIKNCSYSALDLMQCRIRLEAEEPKVVEITKKRKIAFCNDMEDLLIRNILNLPDIIVKSIKLIPISKFVEGSFSIFYYMYVDNASLLKIKSVFNNVQKKVANDHLLKKLVNKLSLDRTDKTKKVSSVYKIIGSHIIYKKLSTYKYIRKLVKRELLAIKYETNNPIMVIRNNKIEIANQEVRNKIFDKLELDLITITIRSYRRLCIKIYKSKNRTETKKPFVKNYLPATT